MNRSQFPPGGWIYYEPATNWNAPTPLASTFNQTVELISKMRRANAGLRLPVDFEVVARDLENFTRRRLLVPREFGNEPHSVSGARVQFIDCTMNGWTVQGPHLTWAHVEAARKNGERLPIYIHAHTCTGDHIICSGLYRRLARHWQVNLLVRPGDEAKVKLLLWGAHDARLIAKTDPEMPAWTEQLRDAIVLRLGDYSKLPFDHWNFDTEWYQHAGVDFRHRWDSFHVPDVAQVPKPDGDYVFVHERPEMFGAAIPIPGERPRPGASIFAHRELLLGAKVLHCCSSSFAAFADSLPYNGQEFHFYHFGREIPKMRHPWNIHPKYP